MQPMIHAMAQRDTQAWASCRATQERDAMPSVRYLKWEGGVVPHADSDAAVLGREKPPRRSPHTATHTDDSARDQTIG